MPRVLVAVPNEKLGHFVSRALREQAYVVDQCASGSEAIRRLQLGGIHVALAVVHAALPDLDGFAVSCEARRRRLPTPILLLGATEAVEERVRGLSSGADDVLSQPLVVEELVARVRALLRRSLVDRTLVCGELEVNRLGRATLAGRDLRCTARERDVLAYLAEHRDELVTRLELLAAVWGSSGDGGSVDVHLSHLRTKLGSHAWMIETVRGKGYRLRSEPE
jgi:DNA-binding response OmpR family regulator